MDFTHPEERQMLADALGRYLQQRYPIETRHRISQSAAGWSAEQWASFAEMGAVGALFAPADAGFGGDGFDIGVVFEQLGRALVVEPFLGTLMAGRVLALAGGRQQLLAQSIAGTCVLAFAHQESQGRYEPADVMTRAQSAGAGWLLSGTKVVIPQLAAARQIVVSARLAGEADAQAGIGLFLVDRQAKGIDVRGYALIDGGRGGDLTLNEAPAQLLAREGYELIETAIAAGIVALSWEAVGLMDVLKTSTLGYLRTRKQFGVPIGKFQALQHRMATVALEIEQARSAAINAAAALQGPRAARERTASAAKYTVGRVGTLVAEESIQMHGGIGMTWELPLGHYAKRLVMIGHQLGDDDYHLERFAAVGQ